MAYLSERDLAYRRGTTRRRQVQQRRHLRVVVALVAGPVLVVAVAIGAFALRSVATDGGAGLAANRTGAPPPAKARGLTPAGLPSAITLARVGGAAQIRLPIADPLKTVIVATGGDPNSLPLAMAGHQTNGDLIGRQLGKILDDGGGGGEFDYVSDGADPARGLDVAADAGTPVYAPVDGQVTQVRPFEIAGAPAGQLVEIQPQSDAGLVVRITGVAGSRLAVGESVRSGQTRLGQVAAIGQRLARAGIGEPLSQWVAGPGDHVRIEAWPGVVSG